MEEKPPNYHRSGGDLCNVFLSEAFKTVDFETFNANNVTFVIVLGLGGRNQVGSAATNCCWACV